MGFLFGKKPSAAAVNTQAFNGLQINKSAYGDVIPVLIGPNRVPMKLIWAGDWKDTVTQTPGQHVGKGLGGGSSSSGQTNHEYSEAVQSLLGYGPCDRIDSFWTQSGKVGVYSVGVNYTVAGGGGFIDVVDSSWSGDQGVGAQVSYSQAVNDYGDPRGSRTLSGTYYKSLVKGTVSAPGVYVISHPVVGTTRYTFNAADAGTAVVITYQALLGTVYQAAEEPIPAGLVYNTPNPSKFWGPNSATTVTNVNTGAAFTRVSGAPAAGQFSVTGTPGTPGGGAFTFNAADAGTLVLIKWQEQDTTVNPANAAVSFSLGNGASGQTPWSYVQSTHPDQALAYPNMALWQFSPLQLGSSNNVPQMTAEAVMTQYMAGGGIAGANPADVIKAILTDPVFGVGMDPTLLADWKTPAGSAWNFWQANNFFISLLEDTQTTAMDVIKRILEAGQAEMFWDQGLLQLAVYGDTSLAGNGVVYQPDTQPVVTFSVDDFLASGGAEPVKVETEPMNHVYNRVKVQWMNALVDYRTEILTEEDSASINLNGLFEEGQQSWEFIRYVQQAQWAANLRLKRYTNIRDTYTWKVPTRYRSLLRLLKLVTVTWAHMGWNLKPLRILKIEESHDGLALTMEEFPYGIAAATLYPKMTAQNINTNPALIAPGNADLVAFEVPDPLNSYSGNVVRIYADPVTPNNWGGANVYYSGDNVNFVPLGQINQSVMMGTLGGGSTPVSDVFTRANANPIGGNWTTEPTMGALQILSNAVTPALSGTLAAAYWNGFTPTNDQSASVTIGNLQTNLDYAAPAVRMGTGASGNYYAAFAQGPLGNNAIFFIQKMVAGAQTNLATVSNIPIHAGDVITIEAVGTTITGLINGAIVLTVTDSSLTSGTAGMVLLNNTTVGYSQVTAWNASSKNQGMSYAGTRIQSTGGSTTWKYFINVDTPSVNGALYTVSCQVRNNGPTNVYLGGNLSPILSSPCAPGATAILSFTCTGNGSSSAQFILYVQNPGDSMDVTVSNPFMSHTGSNQLSPSVQNFSPANWGVGTGATVTVTQGTDPDNQVIQIVDVNAVPLAQPSAFDFNNKNALLAIVDASGTFEIVAYQNVTLVSPNVYNVQGFHRGLFGTAQAAHAAGCNVIQLGPAFLEFQFTAAQAGQTYYFRAASFNKLLGRLQDYTTLTSLPVPLSNNSPGLFTNGNMNPGHASADNISDGTGKSLMANSMNASAVPASNMRGLNLISNPDYANGSLAFQIPSGQDAVGVYDNNSSGKVAISAVSNVFGAYPQYLPNTTGYALKIVTTPGGGTQPAPGQGGFHYHLVADSGVSQVGAYHKGNTIIWRILAKIPKACNINWASNAVGTDGNTQWVTTQNGQGDGNTGNPGASGPAGYQTYIFKEKIGTYGSFSSTGFFYLDYIGRSGGSNLNLVTDSDNMNNTWVNSGGLWVYQPLFGPAQGEWPGTWEIQGTGAPFGGGVYAASASGSITVTPGVQYTVSFFVNSQNVTAGNLGVFIYDPTIATQYAGFAVPNGYGRYSFQWTPAGGQTSARILFHANGCTVSNGNWVNMGNPQIEVANISGSGNTNPAPSTYCPNPLVWFVAECSAIDVDVPQYTSDGYNLMRQGISTSLNAQNSIMPGQTVTFTATQSPTTIGYSWSTQSLTRPDGSTVTLTGSSITFSGLANSTLYYSFPYLTVTPGTNTAVMNWYGGAAGAYTTPTSAIAMNAYLDGRFSLGVIHNTTQSGGGTGGGGGGGNPGGSCPSENELAWVLIGGKGDPTRLRMGDVRPGDQIKGYSFAQQKDVWRKVLSFHHVPTTMWYKVGGYLCSACETVYVNGAWQMAYKVPGATKVRGVTAERVEIQVEHDKEADQGERNYWLDNGTDAPLLMHNWFPFC